MVINLIYSNLTNQKLTEYTPNHIYAQDTEENTQKAQSNLLKTEIQHFNNQNQSTKITAEIADTATRREIGLMYREKLDPEAGMLFIFDGEAPQSFWMKNTLIPLDIIFLDYNKKIVNIAKNAKPCKTNPCPTYPSIYPTKYVLEVNGGLTDEKNIKIGDTLIWD